MLDATERQVAESIDGIRNDHVSRYVWAEALMPEGATVIDLGCGVGYGSNYMHAKGHGVTSYDYSADALAYAGEHYGGPTYRQADFAREDDRKSIAPADVAVAFEVLEHIDDPQALLAGLQTDWLFCSVPNETYFPFKGDPGGLGWRHHKRHYTESEFRRLLEDSGWHVHDIRHQAGTESAVGMVPGRTLVARCGRKPAVLAGHVAILGLGPSLTTFLEITKRIGGMSAFCDEVWGINAAGDIFDCNRIFHMDDVRVQEARGEKLPQSNIANMAKWLRRRETPIFTCHVVDDYPGLVRYPIEAVVHDLGIAYFNSTVAYVIAYAIHKRVARISLFGCDFTYANAHHAEKGRACVEFWVAVARSYGIVVSVPPETSLLDACEGLQANFYGFCDGYEVAIKPTNQLEFTPKDLPTAEEKEAEYDHSVHPNKHVRDQK